MTEAAKEARRAYQRKHYAENADRIKAYQRQWQHDHVDKVREYRRNYWERKAHAADQEEQNE